MSEDKDSKQTPVYFEDFIDFYRAKKLKETCGECGDETARQTIAGLPNRGAKKAIPVPSLVYGVASDDGDVDDIYGAGVGLVASTCGNCGYVRLFSLNKIVEWKRAQEAAALVNESKEDIGGGNAASGDE